ncbi:MAG: Trm112 family protein [Candidatus Zixiibacteriota bacterium]|nr:MAG: Trm112 family protein [candidate division Zixibacteria bacterium]
MSLPEKLLSKLACPQCRGDLRYDEEHEQLVCGNCHLIFRIDNDVPVLLLDEAKPEK